MITTPSIAVLIISTVISICYLFKLPEKMWYYSSPSSFITFKRYWPYWFFNMGLASSRILSAVIQP